MNGVAWDSRSVSILSDSTDACESFLESYSRGNVDVGGIEPPELAKLDLSDDILASGHFEPPLPPDETQRVRELYQFRVLKELNHDIKLGFDRFARLATLVCDAKICIINFLDDKTQYTSGECAPAPWLVHTPIPKPLSICGHTILRRSADIFEVPDTTKDWRFRGKPYVTGEPYIRYYAGAPLRTKSGFNIGSLCVLDYVPKRLTEQQITALKDLANMVMTDLELHRDKELVDLKGRMANSITQFTRGLVKRESKPKTPEERKSNLGDTQRSAAKRHIRWAKKSPTVDKDDSNDENLGAMHFESLGEAQKSLDARSSNGEYSGQDGTETEGQSSEDDMDSMTSSQNLDDIDLKMMYRYACRLMRETLDVEGVCFVDIDGIDWKNAQTAPNYRDASNTDTHTSGQSRREFGAASSILGYSHSARFGSAQAKNWTSIARWDEEAETSNPQGLADREPSLHSRHASLHESTPFMDPEFPVQTGHSVEDGSYVSARTGNHFDDGGFSNQFLANFLAENPYGKIFNDGLPDELKDFLPDGITSAILVPIYDFDYHPFAMTCAYSTNPHKWFVDAEVRYLEGFGSQILSQVLKKRVVMADRAKGIFISNISHELRSPLHGILASAEFLSDTRLDTLQRTFIETIDSCGRTLLEVINHVLDFGKLTYIARLKNKVSRPHIQRSSSKEMVPRSVNAAPVDLMAVVEQVVESCYAGYEFKGLFGQVDIGSMLGDAGVKPNEKRTKSPGYGRAKDPTSALTVIVDVDYREQGWYFLLQSGAVQRILMNITGNALKYTPAGWVKVHLSIQEVDGQNYVHMNVSDSGKGISAEFLKTRLFSPFSQEDTLQAGTGLGMSIVKQVVERLGGQINVTSQVNVGTQVHVSLPADPAPRPQSFDSFARVRSLTKNMKVFLAGFDKDVMASKFLYESMSHYLTNWYNMQLVDNVYSSEIIISDECPELLDYFQQQSPAERSAFALSPSYINSPPVYTPDNSVNNSVYRAWQPLIVLCSNALRYEFFGQQAETGKIIDFSSKPCGPYKLARSLLFCLEQAETRRRTMEAPEEASPTMPPRRFLPSRTTSSTSVATEDSVSSSELGPGNRRRGSFGRGVVRFSPSVRRGSSDLGASMYVPGRGFVPTATSSIVEPPRFVGMRRKSAASPKLLASEQDPIDDLNWQPPAEQIAFKMPTFNRSPASDEKINSNESVVPPRAPSPYNRRNPPRSMPPIAPASAPRESRTGESRLPYILVVEDNSVNALILATFLRKRGYPFAQAENGLLAVQAVQARPEGFDVILMDIQSSFLDFYRLSVVPVMDGSAATAAIRTIERERNSGRSAYIVALTGLAADKDRQLAFDSGVDHFLTKPVSLKQLVSVIDQCGKHHVN